MADLSGRHFGSYEIVEPLGEGGMAVVYKAFQPAMERFVALKVLSQELATEPEFVGRFRQEARLLAGLQHPHILPIFDFGERDGVAYIVMPFIKTGTLADVLRGEPLSIQRATRITVQVGEALDYAHSRGLVHRDIKPSNILLDERGNSMLTDFGIAKLYEATTGFTSTGGIIGTPAYMSPEQGQGDKVDSRTDIYSLGVVFYEMVTGCVPFEADTPIAVVLKHITDPLPPPRTLNPAIPDLVERVILKATAKDPQSRFATAGAMVSALQSGDADTVELAPQVAASAGQGEAARDNRRGMRLLQGPAKWFLLGGTLLLVLILSAGGGLWWAMQRDDPKAEPGFVPELPTPGEKANSRSQTPTSTPTAQPQDTATVPPTNRPGAEGALPLEVAATVRPSATPRPSRTPTITPTALPLGPETIALGESAGGLPVEVVRFGNGPNAVVFVGGIHAGFAPSTVRMAQAAVQHFTDNPQDVPQSATVYVILSMNPDSVRDPGFLPGRLNANGVDLNRNWNCLWTQNPPIDDEIVPRAGGAEPFSEPETRAVADFLVDKEARAVIFWEARAVPGLVLPGACGPTSEVSNPLALSYANAIGYRWQTIENLSAPVVRGDASNWLDLQGIPAIFVLMPSFTEPAWDRNLPAILQVVREYGR